MKSLSGRNRTSDPVIADIYSHMLYQLSYAELLEWLATQEAQWTAQISFSYADSNRGRRIQGPEC